MSIYELDPFALPKVAQSQNIIKKAGNDSVEIEENKGNKQATTNFFVPSVNLTFIEEILKSNWSQPILKKQKTFLDNLFGIFSGTDESDNST